MLLSLVPENQNEDKKQEENGVGVSVILSADRRSMGECISLS